jgi:hypothetical protein
VSHPRKMAACAVAGCSSPAYLVQANGQCVTCNAKKTAPDRHLRRQSTVGDLDSPNSSSTPCAFTPDYGAKYRVPESISQTARDAHFVSYLTFNENGRGVFTEDEFYPCGSSITRREPFRWKAMMCESGAVQIRLIRNEGLTRNLTALKNTTYNVTELAKVAEITAPPIAVESGKEPPVPPLKLPVK